MVSLCGWDWRWTRGGEDGWILMLWAVVATSSRTRRTPTSNHYMLSLVFLRKITHLRCSCPLIYLLEHGCKLLGKCIKARMWQRCKRFCNTHGCFEGGINLEMASSFHLPRSNSTRDTLENTSSESSDNEITGKEYIITHIPL